LPWDRYAAAAQDVFAVDFAVCYLDLIASTVQPAVVVVEGDTTVLVAE
jgi:hypothetical protein